MVPLHQYLCFRSLTIAFKFVFMSTIIFTAELIMKIIESAFQPHRRT
jgi:hypothetical protein